MSDGKERLPYDPCDKRSIIEYAQELVGSSLREHIDVNEIPDIRHRKGSFGNAVERYFFKYDINSDSQPDFSKIGMELKTTPLKKVAANKFKSKERLVITMINYMDIVNEAFETNSFMHKAEDILLISYLYEKEKNPLDYIVEIVAEWGIPPEDLPQIKRDWELVVDKVRAGHAEDISGSDTLYLEACTKAQTSKDRRKQPFSTVLAKPRAWALKASYMTAVSNKLLEKMEPIKRGRDEEKLDLIALVRKRFAPYFGMTELELGSELNIIEIGSAKRVPKHLAALITKLLLGVDEDSKITEFEKAGIKAKTLRLKKDGMPKEAVSFPHFDYFELAETEFEDSDFFGYLQQKYLFVIYREGAKERGVYRLADVMLWQMPDSDLDEAKRCYDEMRVRVIEGHADELVKSSENRCCHVRPHARNAEDTLPVPNGKPEVKKCFWLNSAYLKDQLQKRLV